jgi:NADH dehydrogenase
MKRVVLVGGGYVTLHAYAGLARRLRAEIRRGDVEIVVLTADLSHSFHGFTGEVLAGILPFARTRTPLRAACPQARVVHAVVTGVDPEARTVTYTPVTGGDATTITWEHLVVGAGGREPAAQVPGLAAHGFTLRAPGDIERLATRVAGLRAMPDQDRPDAVVAGGGLAGVELAAALADAGRGVEPHSRRDGGTHDGGAHGIRVHLVHAGDEILPELADQPRLRRRAVAELERLGVVSHLGVRLAEVTATSARLSDGQVLPTTTVLATTGQRPVRLAGLGDDLRDLQGRLATASDLRVVGTDGEPAAGGRVWAAGDAARVLHPTSGDPVPANALWAIKGGRRVGDNIALAMTGHPTRPFTYRGLGRAASFGLGRSVSELYGIPFTGLTAWVLRLAFFLRFMPSRRTAVATLVDVARAMAGHAAPTFPPHEASPRFARVDVPGEPRASRVEPAA